jgi:hypothetical protein
MAGKGGKQRDGQAANIAEGKEEHREQDRRARPHLQRPRLAEADHREGRDVVHEQVGSQLRARAVGHLSDAYVRKAILGDRLQPWW